ncbi:hypothetical protein K445DRAFT_216878 [Daldinia sp. EC12]|nr:hypothetical protein K445DRAFT_216878 [Daldinia sp. EC12]
MPESNHQRNFPFQCVPSLPSSVGISRNACACVVRDLLLPTHAIVHISYLIEPAYFYYTFYSSSLGFYPHTYLIYFIYKPSINFPATTILTPRRVAVLCKHGKSAQRESGTLTEDGQPKGHEDHTIVSPKD